MTQAPRLVLAALNSRRLHTNPALYALTRSCEAAAEKLHLDVDALCRIERVQFALTSPSGDIAGRILAARPDILACSVYIWNAPLWAQLLPDLRLLLPDALIVLGGPEVTARPRHYLQTLPVDGVCIGEGEDSFGALLAALHEGRDVGGVPGWMWRGREAEYRPAARPDVDSIPFLYSDNDLTELAADKKIIYYEASRGCPFHCSFCCSAREPLRLRELSTVLAELERLAATATQIKLVDRTFNADRGRALAITRRCLELYRPGLSWHFEISPRDLCDELCELWLAAPSGYFRLELGVQSLFQEALRAVSRRAEWEAAEAQVKKLIKGGAHLHMDLIAGLPGDRPDAFARSFHTLHQLGPDYLQLGFLKLLPGTPLADEAEELGLVASPLPPYRVLSTPTMSADWLLSLRPLERAFNSLYNKSEEYKAELIELADRVPGGALALYRRAAELTEERDYKDKRQLLAALKQMG